MYCVICGVILRAENQEGIVCRDCKHRHRARERHYQWGTARKKLTLRVQYCFSCGLPYAPPDPSIRHASHPYDFCEKEGQENEQNASTPARSSVLLER